MKKFLQEYGLIAFIFFITSIFGGAVFAESSAVGLFLEPAVTYEGGSTTTNYPSPLSNSTGTIEGLGLGARFGFHLSDSLFLGLDARYSMPKYKDSSVSYDAKAVSTNWGPVVGLQMPIVGLRLWGSYILGGDLDPESSGSFNVKFQEAKGYRVGAGFHFIVVSVNLEYQQLKYDKTVLEQVGPFSSSSALGGTQLENKTWILSASFPMGF